MLTDASGELREVVGVRGALRTPAVIRRQEERRDDLRSVLGSLTWVDSGAVLWKRGHRNRSRVFRER